MRPDPHRVAMPEAAVRPRVAFMSSTWARPHSETAFVARRLAGGLSRFADVDVFVPGPAATPRPDGAFDVRPVGTSGNPNDPWPGPGRVELPEPVPHDLVILDEGTPSALALVDAALAGDAAVATLRRADEPATAGATALLDVGGPDSPSLVRAVASTPAHHVGCHVAVNPLSAARRHAGIGFRHYLLVLTDRGHGGPHDDPTPFAQWLVARFARQVVVVVEDAVASVWRSRSLLGRISVDTRADLWRLIAQATTTVDLRPGPHLARECVESLRYGVPIVVPAGTSGHRLARAGGGLWFRDVAELFGCVETLTDPVVRSTLGRQGREVADRWYGDPPAFVERLRRAVLAIHAGSPASRAAGQR